MSLACTRCGTALPGAALAAQAWTCFGCGSELEVWAFPALWRGPAAPAGASLAAEGEAACFHHPHKRADFVCEGCGRFLCALCEVELAGAHYCPSCLEAGQRATTATSLETQRTLWDQVALSLAVLPLLIFYLTVFTAPIAIAIALRHWRTPGSIVRRSRWRFVVAIVVGGLELAGMAALFLGLYGAWRARVPR